MITNLPSNSGTQVNPGTTAAYGIGQQIWNPYAINITTTGTVYMPNAGVWSFSPPMPPKRVDCDGKWLEIGDNVAYSHGVYGYLKTSVIKRFTKKSVIMENGDFIVLNRLNKIIKLC
jgi:hypothetical protein